MKFRTLLNLLYVFQDFELRDYKTNTELGAISKTNKTTVGFENYNVVGIYTRKDGMLVIQIEKPKRKSS